MNTYTKMTNNWPTKKLGEVTDIYGGGTPSRSVPEYWDNEISWLTMEDTNNLNVVGTVQYISNQGLQHSNAQLIPIGSVNLSCTASVGNVTINRIPLATNQQFNSFHPHNELTPEFLAYELMYRKNEIRDLSGTTTIPFISKTSIANFQVYVPLVDTQKKITAILSSIDETIQKTDQIIQKTEVLKQGMIQELLTKGIGHKKYKKTKLGEIPDEWKIVELQSICDVRDGTHDSPKYVQEGYSLITSKNLTDSGIDFSIVNYISESDFNQVNKRSKVDVGDILFGMIGTIGKPVIVDTDEKFAIKNVVLIKFPNTKSILNKFLLNYLKSNFVTKQFAHLLDGSTQKFIALGTIRKLDIICPNMDEQLEISNILESIETKLKSYIRGKRESIQLKDGLMQDIFS